jgi:hypothetical protein
MLNSFMRNVTAAASPVRMSGEAAARLSVMPNQVVKLASKRARYTVSGS